MKRDWKTIICAVAVVGIVGGLVAAFIRGLVLADRQIRIKACQENLMELESAKTQYAVVKNKRRGELLTVQDLIGEPRGRMEGNDAPHCPSTGQEYIINPVGKFPVCPSGLAEHSLAEIPGLMKRYGASQAEACQGNLRRIGRGKERFAADQDKSPGDAVSLSDAITSNGLIPSQWPFCPATGHDYAVNPVGALPTCPSGLPGHAIADLKDPPPKHGNDHY